MRNQQVIDRREEWSSPIKAEGELWIDANRCISDTFRMIHRYRLAQ